MNFDDTSKSTTAMEEAFAEVGVETAKYRLRKLAEECWDETAYLPDRVQGGGPKAHEPLRTMVTFKARVCENSELLRVLAGERYVDNLIRTFLEGHGNWAHCDAFRRAMKKLESVAAVDRTKEYVGRRRRIDSDWALQRKDQSSTSSREAYRRKVAGIKRVSADVMADTKKLVRLIDKNWGPFGHIRIGHVDLADALPGDALLKADKNDAESRYIRALCRYASDPRKPIGEQVSQEDIDAAKREAEFSNAA